MAKFSAGILPFRVKDGVLELFLVHPGGPFWQGRDRGAWSVAKGEYGPGEDPVSVAQREFEEETGEPAPAGEMIGLDEIKQPSGKRVSVWAVRADHLTIEKVTSNTFEIEWPTGSGLLQTFPEVDRAQWHTASESRAKLSKGQVDFVNRLVEDLQKLGETFSEG